MTQPKETHRRAIETEIWKPSPHDPSRQEYVGQRSALEVFEELRYRLENVGYLPDEYFLIAHDLRDGQEFPKDAYLFCTTDYGGNEGIYVDVSLRIPKEGGGFTTRNFATGKTLGERSSDLDRMFLTASAITKAFHSDGVHSRYMMVGRQPEPEGVVMHLTPQEHRLIVDALVMQRNQALTETYSVEQLLQRTTGGVLDFINEVGARPLKLSHIDQADIAIQDGNFEAFCTAIAEASDEAVQLLPLVTGRPGNVGMKMTAKLLDALPTVSCTAYLEACKCAVEIGDTDRVSFLLHRAEHHVQNLDMSLYGDMIEYAFMAGSENRHGVKMAHDIIMDSSKKQISAANPRLLVCAANFGKPHLVRLLISKGIDANACAAELFHTLDRHGESWQIPHLFKQGMVIDTQNYSALRACVDIGNVEAGEILLCQGMDFDGFASWMGAQKHTPQNVEAMAVLEAVWVNDINISPPEQEQSGPEMQMNL